MVHNRFRARLLAGMRDPWVVLLSASEGAVAWAWGVPAVLAVVIATVTSSTAAVFIAFGGGRKESPAPLRDETRQRELIALLDHHLCSLRALRRRQMPDIVRARVEDAMAAADRARPSVARIAAAVDTLDETISAAGEVSSRGAAAAASIKMTVERLTVRRSELLGRLATAVDEVAAVYAGLLELAATTGTVVAAPDTSDVSMVNHSVTALRMTLAELEAGGSSLKDDGLG